MTSFVVSQFRLARHLGMRWEGLYHAPLGHLGGLLSQNVGRESCRPRELVYTASFDKQGQCLAGMPWKTSRKTMLMLIRSNAVAVVRHGG